MNSKERKRAAVGQDTSKEVKKVRYKKVKEQPEPKITVSTKRISADEMRKINMLKDGGHPARNQNYRTKKVSGDHS